MTTGEPNEPNALTSTPPQLPLAMAAPAPPIAEPPVALRFSKKRILLCFAIAALSDCISIGTTLAPPIQWLVDIATALALFIALGWHWLLLPAMIMEAIPGLGVFPTWVLVVAALATWGTLRRSPGMQPVVPGPQYRR